MEFIFFFIYMVNLIVMAEINTNTTTRGQKGGRRSKKLSTRVDMTPMVDLGFLLITFFMLTTTLSKPKAMNLAMPKEDKDHPAPLAESKALTVILQGNNRIAYYEGMGNDPVHPPVIKHTTFATINGLRAVLINKRKQVLAYAGKNDLMVLIKADKTANYKEVVNVMDEMLINDIPRYAIMDITPQEEDFIKK